MLPCPTALQPPQAGTARTKDEDPNGKQTRDGYAMGYLCARPDVENNEDVGTGNTQSVVGLLRCVRACVSLQRRSGPFARARAERRERAG